MTRTWTCTATMAAAAALLAGAASAAPAHSDRAFLTKALQGDNSETRLGEVAQRKGASPGVRDFGRMLSTDHSQAKADAMPVLRSHGVSPSDEMAPEAKAEQRKLARLSGRAFDREFARYMVKDHKQDIADFEKAARRGDGETAQMARQTLPTLRKHLETAEQLAR